MYLKKKNKLFRTLEKPITFRRQEYLQRSDNIKRIDSSVQLARVFVDNIRTNTPEEERYHTDEELDAVLDHANRVDTWKIEKVNAQEKRGHHLDPVFTSADVNKQCGELDEALVKLMKKKKPKTKKKVPKNESTEEQEPVTGENEKKGGEDEPIIEKEPEQEEEQGSSEEHRKHDEL